MQDLLNRYPVYFPAHDDQLYTLKEYLDNVNNNDNNNYNLPIIVNITSLKNYGRSIKNLLTKNTYLLLLNIQQLDSILAEYHRTYDSHRHLHRRRLILTHGKMATKASTKFRSVRKLSKSVASLTTINQTNNPSDDDDYLDADDNDNTYHQRNLVKSLNEKRSSSIPLCRVPIKYRNFFELLNENDQSIEPCHKLKDLIIIEYDDDNPEKRIEKWPPAFFLRSSCKAYTKKNTYEFLQPTTKYRSSNSASSDSSCGSSSDLDSQKNLIMLNDDAQILQSGQILTILEYCYAPHRRLSDKDLKEYPSTSSSLHLSPKTWMKTKSKQFFSRKSRSNNNVSNEINNNKSNPEKSEPYLKCQTEQGDIIYISIYESGLFSPLNYQTDHLKTNTELSRNDISGVFQLKDLLSNYRFPISVRLLDGSISFDNIYSPAVINRHETGTKFRLLMPYNEHVIFACPLNILSSKFQKLSSSPIVIPLSINADIEIQPCVNMYDISKTEAFQELIEKCLQIIEQYQTEISLIHFPLQLKNNINQQKPLLNKQRSQSECYIEYLDQESKKKFRHSEDQLHNNYHYTDNSSPSISSPLRYRDSIETIKQKLPIDAEGQQHPIIRHSGYYTKIKKDKPGKYSYDENTSEDEMYKDVDKIYDYIRSGDITDDVQKLQVKEQIFDNTDTNNLSIQTKKESDQQALSVCRSPGKMITHRFPLKDDDDFEFHSCKNDKNVDEAQAHALYLASKQRTKDNLQKFPISKSITKMKRINKH